MDRAPKVGARVRLNDELRGFSMFTERIATVQKGAAPYDCVKVLFDGDPKEATAPFHISYLDIAE